jgi:hypothetical protein
LHGIVMLPCTEMSFIVLAVVMSCQIMHRAGIVSCAEKYGPAVSWYVVITEKAWVYLSSRPSLPCVT